MGLEFYRPPTGSLMNNSIPSVDSLINLHGEDAIFETASANVKMQQDNCAHNVAISRRHAAHSFIQSARRQLQQAASCDSFH